MQTLHLKDPHANPLKKAARAYSVATEETQVRATPILDLGVTTCYDFCVVPLRGLVQEP